MARFTVQFPEKTSSMLEELAEREEVSKTEILRRALSVYKFLDTEIRKEKGNKVAIANAHDKILKEILITK